MKRFWELVTVVALGMLSSGCATGVMGPWSYYGAESHKEAAVRRAILRSDAPAEKKHEALKLVALGAQPHEVEGNVGANVISDGSLQYTAEEKWGQAGRWILDIITYGVVGYAGKAGIDSLGGGGDTVTTYNNSGNTTTGNDNQSNTSTATAGQTATSSSGGGGRQDSDGEGGNYRRAR